MNLRLTTFMWPKELKVRLKQTAKIQKKKSRELIIKSLNQVLKLNPAVIPVESTVENKSHTSFKLPDVLLRQVRSFALEKNVSFGRVVRYSLIQYLDENQKICIIKSKEN